MAENINKKHKWRSGRAEVAGVMRTGSEGGDFTFPARACQSPL